MYTDTQIEGKAKHSVNQSDTGREMEREGNTEKERTTRRNDRWYVGHCCSYRVTLARVRVRVKAGFQRPSSSVCLSLCLSLTSVCVCLFQTDARKLLTVGAAVPDMTAEAPTER